MNLRQMKIEIKKKADELKIKMKITSALEDAVGFKQFLDELIKDFVHTFGIKLENKKTFALKSEKDVEVEEGEDNNGKGKKRGINDINIRNINMDNNLDELNYMNQRTDTDINKEEQSQSNNEQTEESKRKKKI